MEAAFPVRHPIFVVTFAVQSYSREVQLWPAAKDAPSHWECLSPLPMKTKHWLKLPLELWTTERLMKTTLVVLPFFSLPTFN
jgi:hypothetical protein